MQSGGRDFDVIVVGAGHNALVTAAYVAKAGYRVGVFERRAIVGGAVSTVEHVQGYQFDLGGSAHILIRLTPIVEELGLQDYGLEYVELDPMFFAPYENGQSVFFYRDIDKTVDHLETLFPSQGLAYKEFLDDWLPFARTVKETFLSVPSPLELGKKFVFSKGARVDWKNALASILKPYGEVLSSYFTEEKIITPMTWMGAQSGPPPTEPLSAPFVLWHPLYHEGGVARPRGGSGLLSVALARFIESHGGIITTGAAVEKVVIENGRAVGIRVQGQTYTARSVVSGTHAHETFGRLLDGTAFARPTKSMRTGNGFGAVLRLALDAPIEYTAHPGREARVGLQLVCRDRQHIMNAYADYLRKEPATDPPIVAMSFSAVDETLAPPGGEVLWLWAQYFPYELANGDWDSRSEEVQNTILDAFERYAPGTRDKIVGSLFQHPAWLERELGLINGNVMHLEMSLDQMFMMRPFLGGASYRTALKGLYVTGASTHPGGGIMGASGRNTARVLLKDLDKKRI